MHRKRKSNSGSGSNPSISTRKKTTIRDLQEMAEQKEAALIDPSKPKVIDVRESLRKVGRFGIRVPRPLFLKIVGCIGRLSFETIPLWLTIGAMLGLIFGGCCSNVSDENKDDDDDDGLNPSQICVRNKTHRCTL